MKKSAPLLLSVWLAVACGPAWRPASPAHLARLHASLDQLEIDITRDDELRKNRLRETVAQTREINEVSAERSLFSNAVVRLWTKMYQDLEVIGKSLDLTAQDVETLEKTVTLGDLHLQEARAEFKFSFHNALIGLIEVLCERHRQSWPCIPGPSEVMNP
jgi:hypothetical protein